MSKFARSMVDVYKRQTLSHAEHLEEGLQLIDEYIEELKAQGK